MSVSGAKRDVKRIESELTMKRARSRFTNEMVGVGNDDDPANAIDDICRTLYISRATLYRALAHPPTS